MKSENQSSRRIRVARNMHDPKWTQDDLLAKMHIRHNIVFTRNGISRIETGQRYVTDLELIAFADVLQVSTAWLLGETIDPTPKKKY
ncbi:MAG: helix-turn-helix domain-containing protein [Acutalibacteraceae bacterium]